MNEMVERVARAICGNVSRELWDKLHPIDRADAVNDALRAITAMREPTPGMVYAAMITPHPTVTEAGGVVRQAKEAVRLEWRAMIDAALGEG